MKTFLFRIMMLSTIVLAAVVAITALSLSQSPDVPVAIEQPQGVAFCGTTSNFGDNQAGKEQFNILCAACHKRDEAQMSFRDFTGQYGNSFFFIYVTKEDSLMKIHNKDVRRINQQAGEAGHVHGYDITRDQANNVLAYLNAHQ